jgi:hypothetical protein
MGSNPAVNIERRTDTEIVGTVGGRKFVVDNRRGRGFEIRSADGMLGFTDEQFGAIVAHLRRRAPAFLPERAARYAARKGIGK